MLQAFTDLFWMQWSTERAWSDLLEMQEHGFDVPRSRRALEALTGGAVGIKLIFRLAGGVRSVCWRNES
jgi:hypothetical protein